MSGAMSVQAVLSFAVREELAEAPAAVLLEVLLLPEDLVPAEAHRQSGSSHAPLRLKLLQPTLDSCGG